MKKFLLLVFLLSSDTATHERYRDAVLIETEDNRFLKLTVAAEVTNRENINY